MSLATALGRFHLARLLDRFISGYMFVPLHFMLLILLIFILIHANCLDRIPSNGRVTSQRFAVPNMFSSSVLSNKMRHVSIYSHSYTYGYRQVHACSALDILHVTGCTKTFYKTSWSQQLQCGLSKHRANSPNSNPSSHHALGVA
jgi:hypothetical protein